MKKLFYSILCAIVLSGLVFSPTTAAPQIQTDGSPATLSFAMLGQTDVLMRGPYSTTNLRFGLPLNWAFQEDANLQLILTSSLVRDGASPIAEGQPIGATLSVHLNKSQIAMIPLTSGTNVTYEIPIRPDALVPSLSDGRHVLELILNADTDCDPNLLHQTSISISSASQLTLPYAEQTPVINLKQLPRPLFQRDSVYPVETILVVPDQPTAQEMQAALIAAAGLGRMSDSQLPFSLVNSSQITEEILTASNLIFLGKAENLSQLRDVELPAPLSDDGFDAEGSQPDDGIMQIAVSPWNIGRALMVVSGTTDAGVVKAAQALSYGSIQTVADLNLAVVTDVAPPNIADEGVNLDAVTSATHTFKDLGYDVAPLTGLGKSEFVVDFYVTPGMIANNGAYLDLVFNNSALLSFERSGLNISLNGNLIGSLRFSDETAGTATQRIRISPSLVLPGGNQLRIQAELAAPTSCSLADSTNLWASILPESSLYLPLIQAPVGFNSVQNLSVYPYPFVNIPTLSNTAFILDKDNPASWATASQIAFGLGGRVRGAVIDLAVAFDDAVPEEMRSNQDLIVVGLPSDLTLISELKDTLPAPFEDGQNVPVVDNQQVSYRFPPETSMGYLQLLASPWNPSQTILTVVGSTNDGVQLAGNALSDPLQRSRLAGNLAVVSAENISVVDTRTGMGMGGIADNPDVISEPVSPASDPSPSVPAARPTWILPAVGVLVFLIIVVLIAALVSSRRDSMRS
ncbi:MAG: cellulose biosynthesis cyclic di-GMP-binding regulatory protein BcsB [Anaerolineales bacterium]